MAEQTQAWQPGTQISVSGLMYALGRIDGVLRRCHRYARGRGGQPTPDEVAGAVLIAKGALAARVRSADGAEPMGPEADLAQQLRDVLGDGQALLEAIARALLGSGSFPTPDVIQDGLDVIALAIEASGGGHPDGL
jgi:hypothetical protein